MAVAILEAAGVPSPPGAVASVVRLDPHSGRLVRSLVRKTEPGPKAAPLTSGALAQTVDRIAQQNQLSPQLIHSVIRAESNYDPNAISPKGALGLMQLIPATARRFGVSDVFDPADNIEGGARYLHYLMELYKGDGTLALAAYNAGEGAVARYGGIPPFPETWDYVARVRRRLEETAAKETGIHAAAVQPSEAPAAASSAELHPPIREVMDAEGKIYYISR